MSNIKEKSISAFIWSFINTGGTQILGLVFGIVLARLLDPSDFGNIAIIIFFTAIANVFVDAGLSHALIRDQACSKIDYDSVFYFGIFISIVCGILLYISAEYIAVFYDEPILEILMQVLSVSPIIYALMAINSTIITKNLDFKLKAKLSLFSIITTSLIAIWMAFNNYGIWSLLVMQILNPFLLMSLLWIKVEWKPDLQFSIDSIKKYINFGLKLSISNFINVFYKNIYVLVIGKSYSSADVGFYTRADSLKNLPAVMLDKVISRVTFPLLSKLQNNSSDRLKYNVKIIKFTAMIVVPIMFGMAAVSEQLIVTLVGEKWLPSAQYLLYLCFVGVFYPFHSINMNIIKVDGDMNLYLKIDYLKVVLLIPVLYLGVTVGLIEMLIGMIAHSVVIFLISSKIAMKMIGYNLNKYIKDIRKPFVFSFVMFLIVKYLVILLSFSYQLELLIGMIVGFIVIFLINELFKDQEYIELRQYIVGN